MAIERREYVVGRGDAMRVADAVQRYQAYRPQFFVPVLLVLVVIAAVGYASSGVATAVGGVVLIAVINIGVLFVQRRRLASSLAARGFRPGARLATEFEDDKITIVGEQGSSTHTAGELGDVRVLRGIALFRVSSARFVLALPVDLVPPVSLRALRSGDTTPRGMDGV